METFPTGLVMDDLVSEMVGDEAFLRYDCWVALEFVLIPHTRDGEIGRISASGCMNSS